MTARPPELPAQLLDGRASVGRTGLAQPVTRPTPARVARGDDPPPFDGRALVRRGPMDHLPRATTTRVLRGEDAPPFAGAAAVGRYGFGEPRRPARAAGFAAEAPPPFDGSAVVARAPLPDLAPQQIAPRPVVARGADESPPGGSARVRQWPRVPSDRLPPRPLVARPDDPAPEPTRATARSGRAEEALPPRPLVARPDGEVRAHAPGSAVVARAPLPDLAPQQQPGPAFVVRGEGAPPFEGSVAVLPSRGALQGGAAPPSLAVAALVGRFVRADAADRSIRRPTRMSALTYVTRTKTPDQVAAVVFDFSNFPEVVGGATIVSAAVSGPGGRPLTGLAAGTPVVLAAAAVIDALGNTVAAGKGVEVALAGGGAGDDVIVSCAATLSTGSVATVQGKIAVRNAE